MTKQLFGLILLLIGYGHAFIVPQEIPSLLSLVYSNIPPIKKGTDSRIGFGYRLGEHADFQVLLELGPQTNTRPIGNAASSDDDSDNSKRNVNQDDYNKKIKSPNPEGTQYLSNWSQDMKTKMKIPTYDRPAGDNLPKPPTPPMMLQTVPFISESALRQLQQLYGKQQQPSSSSSSSDNIDLIGTLPAEKMEAAATTLRKSNIFENSITPQKPPLPTTKKEQAKITADLMDVDFD